MNLPYGQSFRLVTFILLFISCRKEPAKPNTTPPPDPGTPPPAESVKKVLLKDITIPHLPSPYYHFEYNTDSTVSKVDFSSGFTIYDVLYNGNKISEMRNNILVNHDTLRYYSDSAGKVGIIQFINDANITYRHVNFVYNGNQVKEIDWDHKEGNIGFSIDRTLKFTYFPDGNVKTITEHRPAQTGSLEFNFTQQFDQYDDNINVDDFSLVHDGIHDHLFLFQGFRLQRNNPAKETFTVEGGLAYTVDYTYTYNTDHTPSSKTGDLLYTAGPDSAKRFQTNETYTYY